MRYDLYLSGFVQRWHTDPWLAREGQTNAQHQWGVALLIMRLHPAPSAALVFAALTHDAGEYVTGDMPYRFKQRYPEIGEPLETMTDRESAELRGAHIVLTEQDEKWLAFADRLESVLYVRTRDPDRLSENDWRSLITSLRGKAFALGVGAEVESLLQSAGL